MKGQKIKPDDYNKNRTLNNPNEAILKNPGASKQNTTLEQSNFKKAITEWIILDIIMIKEEENTTTSTTVNNRVTRNSIKWR